MSMAELKKTIKLKLDLEPGESEKVNEIMCRYAEAVNFLLKRCSALLLQNRRLGKDSFEGVCSNCGQKSKIVSSGSLGQLCNECWKGKLSYPALRKEFIPTKKRRVLASKNVYLAARGISASSVDVAFSHTKQILASWFGADRKRQRQLKNLKKRLQLWKEVLENKKIEMEGKHVDARVVIPPGPKQRMPRFKHVLHPAEYKGRTLTGIKAAIEKIEKRIRRLEKEPTPPKFRGETMWLKNTSVKFLDEKTVKLALNGHKFITKFFTVDVKREKSRAFLLDRVRRILEMQEKGIRAYPQLSVENGSYYLNFPIRISTQVPEPDGSFGVIGVDRGINNIIAAAAINHPHGKPHHLWFEGGKDLRSLQIRKKWLRHKMQKIAAEQRDLGKRFRLGRKLRSMRGEGAYSKNLFHNIAKRVVSRAKELYPDGRVVIAMEDLKELRPVRGKKYERALNYMLSSFAYRRLQQLIKYKAEEAGIPVVLLPPEWTSTTCSKCGHNDPANRPGSGGFFRCTRCGYTMNSDLNAAINIANRFYEKLNLKNGRQQR